MKSALQHGVVVLPGALQVVARPAKRLPAPWQLCGGVMVQEEPQQQAPRQMVLGVQTAPGMGKPPCAAQVAVGRVRQTPLGVQQATVGVQRIWEQVALKAQVPPMAMQSACVMETHEPSGRQHALRQGLGEHAATPVITKPLQAVGEGTITQLPSGWQQTKPGGGQGLGLHVPPRGPQAPLQALRVVMVQVPLMQHGPVQGSGLQAIPGVKMPTVVGQLAAGTTMQAPLNSQQAPVGVGHGLGLHVPLGM